MPMEQDAKIAAASQTSQASVSVGVSAGVSVIASKKMTIRACVLAKWSDWIQAIVTECNEYDI